MSTELVDLLRTLGLYLLGFFTLALVLALVLIAVVARRMRRMTVPYDASFVETLWHVPFLLVVGIDLLDLALDILAVPFTWIILDRWGLKALRNVSVVQAAVPFTQAIPVLTISWIGVRVLKIRNEK